MNKDAVVHHLLALVDGDDLLKRAKVSDFVEALEEIAATAKALAVNSSSVAASVEVESEEAEVEVEVVNGIARPQLSPPLPTLPPDSPPTADPPLPTNMFGLEPCLRCGGTRRYPLANGDVRCDDCDPHESVPALTFAFPEPPLPEYKSQAFEWTPEQKGALDQIAEWRSRALDYGDDGISFFSLTGCAGTGKTTMLRQIADEFGGALTAMTGKAALRLSQVTGRSATTLHKVLYYPPKPGEEKVFTRLREPESQFVIVDESSMCTPAVFADLKRWGIRRALLVGDSYQLPPVLTGKEAAQYGDDYSVFAHVKGAELKTVMRSVGGVLRAATRVRETGEICRQSDLDADGSGYAYAEERHPTERAIEEYLADRDDHLLITWRNAVRMAANRLIRSKLGHGGPLPDVGEPVLIKRNHGFFLNGEIVECGGFEAGPKVGSLRTLWMTVPGVPERLLVSVDGGSPEKNGEPMDGSAPWVEDWRKYHADLSRMVLPEPVPITFAYCLTAHSAQGNQSKRTTVFLERGDVSNKNFRKPTTLPSGEQVPFAIRWAYTSATRSVTHTAMIVGR